MKETDENNMHDWNFERLPDGSVQVTSSSALVQGARGGWEREKQRFTADQWAYIVARVSGNGATEESVERAKELHWTPIEMQPWTTPTPSAL